MAEYDMLDNMVRYAMKRKEQLSKSDNSRMKRILELDHSDFVKEGVKKLDYTPEAKELLTKDQFFSIYGVMMNKEV